MRPTMLTRCGLFGGLFLGFVTVLCQTSSSGVQALGIGDFRMEPEETVTDLRTENISTDTEPFLGKKTRKRRGKKNTLGVPSFLQWGIGGLLRGADLRGTIGKRKQLLVRFYKRILGEEEAEALVKYFDSTNVPCGNFYCYGGYYEQYLCALLKDDVIVSTGVSMVNPEGCASQLINIGYLNDLYDEDDYPFQPNCDRTQSTENRIACFPATATVLTPEGRVTMGELKPGTLIATGPVNRPTRKMFWKAYDAKAKGENSALHMSENTGFLASEDYIAYERVLFFLHRNSSVVNQEWVTIQWQSENTSSQNNYVMDSTPGNSSGLIASRTGQLYVSPYHLIYTCSRRSPQAKKGVFEEPFKPFRMGQQSISTLLSTKCKPTAALRVRVGDWILVTHETLDVNLKKDTPQFAFALVTRTRLTNGSTNETMSKFDNSTNRLTGLFAPVTASGSLLVDHVYVSQYSTFAEFAPQYDSIVHNAAHLLIKPFVLLAQYDPEKMGHYVSAWMDRLRESVGRTFLRSHYGQKRKS